MAVKKKRSTKSKKTRGGARVGVRGKRPAKSRVGKVLVKGRRSPRKSSAKSQVRGRRY